MNATASRLIARHSILAQRVVRPSTLSVSATVRPLQAQPWPSRRSAETRRALSTTPSRNAWNLSSLWPKPKSFHDELVQDVASTGPRGVESVHESIPADSIPAQEPVVEAQAAADLAAASSPAADSASEAASVTADSAAAAATSEGFTNFITGYDGQTIIDSASLDLSALAGSWGLHPIMRIQSMMLKLHQDFPFLETGLKWAILVPVVTLALRSILFYFQVGAQKNAAKMAIAGPRMKAAAQKLKMAKASGDPTAQQLATIEMQTLMRKEGINPLRSLFFPLAQGAVFISVFLALRGLAASGLPSLHTEGMFWFQDLALPDPYWILPITSSALTLLTIRYGMDTATAVETPAMTTMKGVMQISMILAIPFFASFPTLVLLYWVSTNLISLLQSLLLKQPAVRSFFGIPKIPKKPQPGEPGYVKEQGFLEAFKELGSNTTERAHVKLREREQQKEIAERNRVVREQVEARQAAASGITSASAASSSSSSHSNAAVETDATAAAATKRRQLGEKEARVLEARQRRRRARQE